MQRLQALVIAVVIVAVVVRDVRVIVIVNLALPRRTHPDPVQDPTLLLTLTIVSKTELTICRTDVKKNCITRTVNANLSSRTNSARQDGLWSVLSCVFSKPLRQIC